jgi:hypothetical protein
MTVVDKLDLLRAITAETGAFEVPLTVKQTSLCHVVVSATSTPYTGSK